jgi:pimeloyl-ACP methyl ester carboxylesterase
VHALQSALDGRVMVVAPALDLAARWDSPRGQAVVEETLRTLPDRADRQRLVLVGLSNGAVFGAKYAPLFRGTVLVSGLGEPGGKPSRGTTVALVGEGDVRMRANWVKAQAHSLSIPLEVVEGADHGLLLTHADRVARQVIEMLMK